LNLKSFRDFNESYYKLCHKEPSFDSILAYNKMIILDSCFKNKAKEILNCITNNQFHGVNGVLQIQNNKIKYNLFLKSL